MCKFWLEAGKMWWKNKKVGGREVEKILLFKILCVNNVKMFDITWVWEAKCLDY